jgi:hypothetical protein
MGDCVFVRNYQMKFSLTTADFSIDLDSSPSPQDQTFHWSYNFSDGSHLQGRVKGQLDHSGNILLNPKDLEAEYFGSRGDTALLNWTEKDFAVFDATVKGDDLLIVGSNDQFTTNSLCLVSSPCRSRAQVTHWGMQLNGEDCNITSWSLTPIEENAPKMTLNWQISCFFPFVAVSFNIWKPKLQKYRQWVYYPYLFWLNNSEIA